MVNILIVYVSSEDENCEKEEEPGFHCSNRDEEFRRRKVSQEEA